MITSSRTAGLAGGLVPHAVDGSACTAPAPTERYTTNTPEAKTGLRAGPADSYAELAALEHHTAVSAGGTTAGGAWTYVVVEDGPHRGASGWVDTLLLTALTGG